MDANAHLAIGRALQPLREEGVLIVGSGMTYHNLRGFRDVSGRAAADSIVFDDWLTQAVTDSDPAQRDAKLARWASAPAAKACHPEPEHLLPLHVAAGAAGGDIGRRVYEDRLLGLALSAYQFG
jgi:aromatic ring-opening dioxygenase catalytic subunit (LigB family)